MFTRGVSCLILVFGYSLVLLSVAGCPPRPTEDPMTPNPIRAQVSTALEEPYEILEDGGFEQSDHDVRLVSPHLGLAAEPATAERLGVAARTGDWGYRIVSAAANMAEFSLRANPDKAEDITFSCWVRSEDASVNLRALIAFEDARSLADGPYFGDAVTVGTDWTKVSLTVSTTAGFLSAYAGIEMPQGCVLHVDDASVTVPVWRSAEIAGASRTVGGVTVPAAPVAPIKTCFSIHIEDPQVLVTDETYFRRKTAVFEELASLFYERGGFLNIQPELEWALGADRYEPGLLERLAADYAVTYSTHTHGPVCVDASGTPWGAAYCNANHTAPGDHSVELTDEDIAEYIEARRLALEERSGTPVTDHNGNFDLVDKDILYGRGVRTLSALKIKYTQRTYDYLITNPWRPSNTDILVDLDAFLVHDPERSLIYIPGVGVNISRRHERVPLKVQRFAGQFIKHADAERVNAMNLVLHVDAFTSSEGLPENEYIRVLGVGDDVTVTYSSEFERHLQYWDDMLTDTISPLVDAGYLEWATHADIAGEFTAWEQSQ